MRLLNQTLKKEYFGEDIPLDVQTFNLLCFIGTAAGILIAVSCFFSGAGLFNASLNICASCLSLLILGFTKRTSCYHLAYWIVVIALFIVGFPAMFFTAGGYRSGMPSFYVFAFVFTVLMLRGWQRVFALSVEFITYILTFLIAYRFPQTVTSFPSESAYLLDVIIGSIFVGALLISTVLLYIRIYDNHRKKLERLNNLYIEFLGNVSHELKTPLTSISGFAQACQSILQNESLVDMDIRQLQVCSDFILSESNRMIRLTQQLLDVTKVDYVGMTLNREKISIIDIIQSIKDYHFCILDKNKNTLIVDIPETLPPVYADYERVLQIFINILSNALQHTKSGIIAISARQEKQEILLTIRDTGVGIPDELKAVLFDRYLNVGVGHVSGTGIGLYVCKKIIEAHDCKIWIESELGKGTAVFFTLHAARGQRHEQQNHFDD